MKTKWDWKKQSLLQELHQASDRSRILTVLNLQNDRDGIQAVVQFRFPTLIKCADNCVSLAGPIVVGLRYGAHLLSEAPHPLELAAILTPAPFHPNCSPHGLMCLGHPTLGISLVSILHQVWAAVTFNMKCINVRPGEVMNREAADYVRLNPERFPLTDEGLFEAVPVWHPAESPRLAKWYQSAATPQGASL